MRIVKNPIKKINTSETLPDNDIPQVDLCRSKSSGYPSTSKVLWGNDNQSKEAKSYMEDAISIKKSMSVLEEVEKFKTIPLKMHLFLLIVYTISCCSSYYIVNIPNSLQTPLKHIGIGASQTVRLKTFLAIGGLITLPFSGIIINKLGDGPSLL